LDVPVTVPTKANAEVRAGKAHDAAAGAGTTSAATTPRSSIDPSALMPMPALTRLVRCRFRTIVGSDGKAFTTFHAEQTQLMHL
jgi:hypothetical protein